jgi:intracellular septation protein A
MDGQATPLAAAPAEAPVTGNAAQAPATANAARARATGNSADTPSTADAADAPATADAANAVPTPAPRSLRDQLALLAFDIAAPTALYYILRSVGASNLAALSISAVLPAVAAIYKLAVKRRVDAVALVVVAAIAVSIALSLVAHDVRFLLARDGYITALWGLWFLATLRARRPAALVFARPLMEGRKVFGTRSWESLWETDATFRRIWRISTVMWASALLADAAARVVMAYSLPVDVVPGLGAALWPVTFVLIQIVTNVYYHRAGLYRILGAPWLGRV